MIDQVLDAIIAPIAQAVGNGLQVILSIQWLTIIIWIALINVIGWMLMKRDKEYAKEEKRRVRESTLLATALAGGSLGIYAGMYHFHHKTLHTKFTIGVPMIMLFQVAFVIYQWTVSWI